MRFETVFTPAPDPGVNFGDQEQDWARTRQESDKHWQHVCNRYVTNATIFVFDPTGGGVQPYDPEDPGGTGWPKLPPLVSMTGESLFWLSTALDSCRQDLIKEAVRQNLLAGTVYFFVREFKQEPVEQGKPPSWSISFYCFFRYDVLGAELQDVEEVNPQGTIQHFLGVPLDEDSPSLNVGDTVVLKSGPLSFAMTVNSITGDIAECVWIDAGGACIRQPFNVKALALVNPLA